MDTLDLAKVGVLAMTIRNLLQHMEELISTYHLLFEVAERRRQVLLQQDTDGLAACYHDELHLLEQLSRIQSAWEASAVEYMQSRGADLPGAITIDVIVELLPENEERERLLGARDQLAEIVGQIKRLNLTNRQLIERTLQKIDYIVELYRTDGEQDMIYHNPAAKHPYAANMTNRFESRA